MPKLPDYTTFGERPTPRTGLGKVSYRATSGSETAPGQGLVRIGQSLVNVSEEIEKENLRVDTLRAEDATNELLSKRIDLTSGDEGFTNKKGGDAANNNILEDYSKRFDSAVEEITNKLGNERQKSFLRKRANVLSLQYKQDILNHVTREKDSYAKQVFTGTLDTETSNAIERYRDPYGVAQSLVRIDAVTKAEAERTGMAPEQLEAIRRDSASKIYRGIIERHLANDDDISATAQYQKIKGTLNSEDTVAVERALEIGSTRGKAQRNADSIMAKHGDNFGLAVEQAKKISNPKVREATLANIRQAKSDREAAIKLDENDAFTSALQYVQANGDTNFRPDLSVRISKEGHDALEKMAAEVREKRTPVNDTKKWLEFKEMAKDRNWLTGLSDSKFYVYMMSFGDEERDRASALRDAAVQAAKGDAKAKEFLRNDVNLGEMVKTKVFNAGIIDPTKKPSKYEEDEKRLLADLELQASKALEEFQVKNKRKATTQEEEEVVRGLLQPHLKVKVQKNWWMDPTKKLGELTPDEMARAYVEYENVPADDRDFLKRRSMAMGIKDVSEERIAQAYTILLTTKNLPASDRRARIDAILSGR